MEPYRSDRVVKLLTTVVSICYFAVFVGTGLSLILPPAAKLWGDADDWVVGLGHIEVELPATALDSAATAHTSLGPVRLEVAEVRADFHVPIGRLPWRGVALVWLQLFVGSALVLSVLYHLRRIFQRVRDGAPFDADNALRLRWLGILLLAVAAFRGITELARALTVRGWLERSGIDVPIGLHIDGMVVFVALVLIALAEIFRRGAELEHEQSLVV
jgi:hypothetical protein